jgi:allantoicase
MTAAFVELIDLASVRLGGAVVAANDEFFAPKERLLAPAAPVWRESVYTERGKWMDGWETRRRREPGHDWCVVRLGAAGTVRGVDVETTHFKGNFPEACAIDVCTVTGADTPPVLERATWTEVLARTPLAGDAHNLFPIQNAPRATHLRLRIFPDGGVARLRAYGDVEPDWERLRTRGQIDLAAAQHGGIVVGCSDMFFGSRHNLIMPGEPLGMSDGWETRRRRGPGHDWTIVKLGAAGDIERIEVDTRYFKGNAPGACGLEACVAEAPGVPAADERWRELVPRTSIQADTRNVFEPVAAAGAVTHVRLNIYPDGGVARLRLYGRPR